MDPAYLTELARRKIGRYITQWTLKYQYYERHADYSAKGEASLKFQHDILSLGKRLRSIRQVGQRNNPRLSD